MALTAKSRPRRSHRPPLTFRVRLARHTIAGGRWEIPASCVRLPAANAEHARLEAVQAAHIAAGIPAWRPCIRESLPHAVLT